MATYIVIFVLLLFCGTAVNGLAEKDPKCYFLPRAGHCDGSHNKRWYYNLLHGWCQKFERDKCAHNDNGFSSCEECNIQCKTPVCVEKVPKHWWWG
uniref:Pancreatic trypsin inhibitor n=1 Tax=Rhipicephalus appendiculatus TaxID=34631 RepID=A0A131YBH1_RHIAP